MRGWFLGTRTEELPLVLAKATFPYREMTYTHNEISCFFFKYPPFRPSFRINLPQVERVHHMWVLCTWRVYTYIQYIDKLLFLTSTPLPSPFVASSSQQVSPPSLSLSLSKSAPPPSNALSPPTPTPTPTLTPTPPPSLSTVHRYQPEKTTRGYDEHILSLLFETRLIAVRICGSFGRSHWFRANM